MSEYYNFIAVDKKQLSDFLKENNLKMDIYSNVEKVCDNHKYTVSIELENWNYGGTEPEFFYLWGEGDNIDDAIQDLVNRRNKKNFHLTYKSGEGKKLVPFFSGFLSTESNFLKIFS